MKGQNTFEAKSLLKLFLLFLFLSPCWSISCNGHSP